MALPEYPSFQELTLEMAEPVRAALAAVRPELSEFTFSNLFLFRRAHGYRVARWRRSVLVAGRGYDGRPYAFPPLGDPAEVAEASLRLCDHLASSGVEPMLFPVPTNLADTHFSGPDWTAVPDRDQADYVYSREELATLPGPKFHKRRNRLAKFLREEAGEYTFEPLGETHTAACLELARDWCEIRCSPQRPSTYLETEAAREALLCRTALGLEGGVIVLAGRVVSFCLGEELNPETFVVHFEKTDAGREGLAQLMNRDFCLKRLARYRYVNREQDLGDPGLRRAKEQYNPLFLAEKYRVLPR